MKRIKNIGYLLLFLASPLLMIAGVLIALYSYPNIPIYTYAILGAGFLLKLCSKNLEKGFNRNMQEMEYDELGRKKGMEDYSAMSRKERAQIDKQKLADMERIVSSIALRRMAKPGSKNPEVDMEALIGLHPVKRQMSVMAARMEYDREAMKGKNKKQKMKESLDISRHMIFSGSPGTGKTTVARIMTGFLYKNGFIKENRCVETDGNFLKASTTADTAAKTTLVIQSAFGGVLFIDEAYALLSGDAAGEAAIATLIKQMEDNRDKFILIIAGYTTEMKRLIASNPGFASRFKDHVEFPDYTDDELEQIFVSMVNSKNLYVSSEALQNFLVRIHAERKKAAFGNGRTVRNIVEESIDCHALGLKDGRISESDRYRLCGSDVSEKSKHDNFWK